MQIHRLQLTSFRNHAAYGLDMADSPAVICLHGENGVGKTNILEAISLLTPGRGFRSASLEQLQKVKSSVPWAVFAEVLDGDGLVTAIGTGGGAAEENARRVVKIDGVQRRSQADLSEVMAIAALSPAMDQVFALGQASRRDYLDQLIVALSPGHARQMAMYDQARSERRRILQRYQPDNAWLGAIERRMAEPAVAIAALRLEGLQRLQHAIMRQESNFPAAELSVEGEVEHRLNSGAKAAEVEQFMREQLAASRTQDAASGRTQFGVHRSDFVVMHDGAQLPAQLCSTGQQKALLISITLAVVSARTAWHGDPPVVLLDDVFSHLDAARQELLLHELQALGAQCWLTMTELPEMLHSRDDILQVKIA